MKLSTVILFFLAISTAYIFCDQQFLNIEDEKLVYVDGIKHLLNGHYVFIEQDDQERAITTYGIVIDALEQLPIESLQHVKVYIEQLQAGDFDVADNEPAITIPIPVRGECPCSLDTFYFAEASQNTRDERDAVSAIAQRATAGSGCIEPCGNCYTRKKLKDKIYCSLLVKQKLVSKNLKVCNDTTLNNLTVNGELTLNLPGCLEVNCITTNTITANFITTKTLVADLIIGMLTGTAEFAISAEFFTGPLLGDVTGTQSATHVAFVCGLPACALAQTYSTVLSATSSNVCGTLVLRDSNCNFSANLITATVTNALLSQTALFATSALTSVSAQFANTANFALTSSSAISALTSITAVYFTGNLYGDVIGTQTATQVAFVCGVPACSLAQAYSLVLAATSADIPLTLVLRDSTGSFAATTLTLTGCLVLTDSLNNIAGTVCANTNALIVAPQTTRALQTTLNGNIRGINAIDLQMVQNSAQVASGNYSGILSGSGNTASGFFSVVPGGYNNTASGAGAVVAGGGTDGTLFSGNTAAAPASFIGSGVANTINVAGSYSSITSGFGNTISAPFAIIGGGLTNTISAGASYAVIGGGINNLASASFSAVLSGSGNTASASAIGAVICGGGYDGTRVGGNSTAAPASFIGSGLSNTINAAASYSGIVSGSGNTVSAPFAFLGAGQANTISAAASYGVIGGGFNNMVSASFSAVLSGSGNIVTGTGSVICGGGFDGTLIGGNSISAPAAFIGGGLSNTVNAAASYSCIGSGSGNTVSAPFAMLGGGRANTISSSASYAVIGGGLNNNVSASFSAVLSGENNIVTGTGSVICGGGFDGAHIGGNTISAPAAFIGSGLSNTVNAAASYSCIGSGSGNTVSAPFAMLGGGQANTISAPASYAVIGGGLNNLASASFSAVLSGSGNTASGICAVVCGGGTDGTINAGNVAGGNVSFIGGGLGNIITSAGSYSAIVSGSVNMVSAPFAFVGGGLTNTISAGANYAVIGAGQNNIVSAPFGGILGGSSNIVTGTGAVVCGGGTDGTRTIGNNAAAPASFIGSGLGNIINASGTYSSIVSGSANVVSAPFAFIGGGLTNTISAGADHAAIGGGLNNTVTVPFGGIFGGSSNTVSGIGAVICGGGYDGTNTAGNTAAGAASFIGGGSANTISSNAPYSAILCGTSNSITGASNYSVIAGGNTNSIQNAPNAFAAGTNVLITATGAFAWADTSSGLFTVTLNNSFNIRSSGGTYIWSTAAGASGNGVKLNPNAGTWSSVSDVNLKTNIVPVDTLTILDTLCTITTYTWGYIAQDPSIIHIGPMAQDLYAAFGYGEDPCYIGTSDALGILAASIQALYGLYQAPTKKHFSGFYEAQKVLEEQQLFINDLEERIKRLEDSLKKGAL